MCPMWHPATESDIHENTSSTSAQGYSCVAFFNGPGSVRVLHLAPDARTLYVGAVTPGIHVWDVSPSALAQFGADLDDRKETESHAQIDCFQSAVQGYNNAIRRGSARQENVISRAQPMMVRICKMFTVPRNLLSLYGIRMNLYQLLHFVFSMRYAQPSHIHNIENCIRSRLVWQKLYPIFTRNKALQSFHYDPKTNLTQNPDAYISNCILPDGLQHLILSRHHNKSHVKTTSSIQVNPHLSSCAREAVRNPNTSKHLVYTCSKPCHVVLSVTVTRKMIAHCFVLLGVHSWKRICVLACHRSCVSRENNCLCWLKYTWKVETIYWSHLGVLVHRWHT